MQTTSNDDRLTIEQAAPILGIAVSSLRQLIYAQRIKFMRIGPNGGRYRFRREWLDEYLRSCEVAPASDVHPAVDKPPRVIHPPKQPRRAKASDTNQPLASFKDELKTFKKQMKGKA
jgi:excisionase family DNA binding protein